MDIKNNIKIKTQLRLSMNGVVSQAMREKGLNYKINFELGAPYPKALLLPMKRRLAQALWKEDIREC